MQKNKLSLGAFTKAISQVVSDANRRLLEEAGPAESGFSPDPLCIRRMRVSFSARVSRSDRILQDNGTAELMLDFERGGPNFHGEMVFLPFAQASESWQDANGSGEGGPETGWDAPKPFEDAGRSCVPAGPQDDTKKVAVRPLEGTGGFEDGNR